MSLQSRLASLISSFGNDIRRLYRKEDLFFLDDQGTLVIPIANGTTFNTVGSTNPTAIGTATSSVLNTAGNSQAKARRVDFLVTTAATNAIAGWRQGTTRVWRGTGFDITQLWGPATGLTGNSTHRAFVGLRSSIAAPTDVAISSLTSTQILGFGWESNDTNIQFFHSNGASTPSRIDTGFAKPTSDRSVWYKTRIWCLLGETKVNFSIAPTNTDPFFGNTGASTNIPVTTQLLAESGYISVGGTSSVVGMAYGGTSMKARNLGSWAEAKDIFL